MKDYLLVLQQNGTWETALIINHAAWNNGSKLEDTKKFFQVNIHNSAGNAKLDVVLIVNESRSSKTPISKALSTVDSGSALTQFIGFPF